MVAQMRHACSSCARVLSVFSSMEPESCLDGIGAIGLVDAGKGSGGGRRLARVLDRRQRHRGHTVRFKQAELPGKANNQCATCGQQAIAQENRCPRSYPGTPCAMQSIIARSRDCVSVRRHLLRPIRRDPMPSARERSQNRPWPKHRGLRVPASGRGGLSTRADKAHPGRHKSSGHRSTHVSPSPNFAAACWLQCRGIRCRMSLRPWRSV